MKERRERREEKREGERRDEGRFSAGLWGRRNWGRGGKERDRWIDVTFHDWWMLLYPSKKSMVHRLWGFDTGSIDLSRMLYIISFLDSLGRPLFDPFAIHTFKEWDSIQECNFWWGSGLCRFPAAEAGDHPYIRRLPVSKSHSCRSVTSYMRSHCLWWYLIIHFLFTGRSDQTPNHAFS